jgi:protein O-GlcNAc transferase
MEHSEAAPVSSVTAADAGGATDVRLSIDDQLILAQRHRRSGRLAEAEAICRRVLRASPGHPDALHLLGVLALQLRHAEIAIAFTRKAITANPNEASYYQSLGSALVARRRFSEAASVYEQALAINPRQALAHNGLACALLAQGRVDESIAAYRRALTIDPGKSAIHSNLLLALLYSPAYDAERLLAESKDWASGQGDAPAVPASSEKRGRHTRRRLRVGYVSADFRQHSVAYLFAPVLSVHNRDQVEVFCYTNSWAEDDMTEHIRSNADSWRSIAGLNSDEAESIIRKDCIDILVELSGHTSGNRLDVFTRRLAPIQVTWLGYPGTTGSASIDFIIADSKVIPQNQDRWYTESIVRMPSTYLCYKPQKIEQESDKLPLASNGYITFGSFNNISKVTPEVVDVWAKVVRQVPGAQMCLKSGAFDDSEVRARYAELFARRGVHVGRLTFIGRTSQQEHLKLYSQVDIALDPFPYNGTVTSLESLWMGVPVISLEGDRFVSRVGLTLLSALGLEELVARSTPEYIKIAAELASNAQRLAALRTGLPSRMMSSALLDGRSFTEHLEAVYREMWHRWLRT